MVACPAAISAKPIASARACRCPEPWYCTGWQLPASVKVTGRRATICVVGLALKPIEVPFIRLWGHEKKITFSSGYQDEFSAAIAYLEDGRVKVDQLITGHIPLEDLVEGGIKELRSHPDKHVKILVHP